MPQIYKFFALVLWGIIITICSVNGFASSSRKPTSIIQAPPRRSSRKNAEDWEFSSACDYAGLRSGQLINLKFATKYVSILNLTQ